MSWSFWVTLGGYVFVVIFVVIQFLRDAAKDAVFAFLWPLALAWLLFWGLVSTLTPSRTWLHRRAWWFGSLGDGKCECSRCSRLRKLAKEMSR